MDQVVQTALITAVLTIVTGGGALAFIQSWNKRREARNTADIKDKKEAGDRVAKEEASAHVILLAAQVQDRSQTFITITELRTRVQAAEARADLAFTQVAKANEDNTVLRLAVQRLQDSQDHEKTRVADLEKKVDEVNVVNVALVAKVAELTSANAALVSQVAELTLANTALKAQVEKLVNALKTQDSK